MSLPALSSDTITSGLKNSLHHPVESVPSTSPHCSMKGSNVHAGLRRLTAGKNSASPFPWTTTSPPVISVGVMIFRLVCVLDLPKVLVIANPANQSPIDKETIFCITLRSSPWHFIVTVEQKPGKKFMSFVVVSSNHEIVVLTNEQVRCGQEPRSHKHDPLKMRKVFFSGPLLFPYLQDPVNKKSI